MTSLLDQVLADRHRCSAPHVEDGAALTGQRRHEPVQPGAFDQPVTAIARPRRRVAVIQRDDPSGLGMLVNHNAQHRRGIAEGPIEEHTALAIYYRRSQFE